MLATVARFLDPWEAHIVRARLEADGIPASVAHANHAIANWPMSIALGGTAVQVPASCLKQSRKILSDYQTGALEDELHAAIGTQREHCPRCGSTDFVRTMPWQSRVVAALVIVIFAPFPTSRTRRVCKHCQCTWRWGDS
jgi:hypothetical protein